MLLYEPSGTSFDLRFRLFGVPVRVHPLFWLVIAVLGWTEPEKAVLPGNGLGDMTVWVFAVFLSILLHEFGHIWMGQLFGSYGYIVLHSMGGLAIGASQLATRWKRICVSAAGPAIQLVLWAALFGLLWAGMLAWAGSYPALRLFFAMMFGINLYWPLLNLLPIWPLDGGQISQEVFTAISPRKGTVAALWLSLVLAAVIAVNAFLGRGGNTFLPSIAPVGLFAGFMFASFAYSAWQAIQIEQSSQQAYEDNDDRLPWER